MNRFSWLIRSSVGRRELYGIGSSVLGAVSHGIRGLYSLSHLGIDGFLERRDKHSKQLGNKRDYFIEKMKTIAGSNTTSILMAELKMYIYICNSSQEEIDLLYKLLFRYTRSDAVCIRLSSFNFGPEVMRLLFHLNLVEEAWKCFHNKELSGFFDQITSYTIIMDMLLQAKDYEKVIELMWSIKNKRNISAPFPRSCFVLAMAACYSMKSQEGLEQALKLMSEAHDRGKEIGIRSLSFAAALALHVDRPEVSLDVLYRAPNLPYYILRNIKCLALARLGKHQDALSVLYGLAEVDISAYALKNRKPSILNDMLVELESALRLNADKALFSEFMAIQKKVNHQGLVFQETLDQILLKPIEVHSEPLADSMENQRSRQRAMLAAAFNQALQRRPTSH